MGFYCSWRYLCRKVAADAVDVAYLIGLPDYWTVEQAEFLTISGDCAKM
jgi:hypothetical protein